MLRDTLSYKTAPGSRRSRGAKSDVPSIVCHSDRRPGRLDLGRRADEPPRMVPIQHRYGINAHLKVAVSLSITGRLALLAGQQKYVGCLRDRRSTLLVDDWPHRHVTGNCGVRGTRAVDVGLRHRGSD